MLKTTKNNQLWMVTQPDHAEVAGYLAAHWGNDHFARPGHYAPAPDAERLRAEVIFAVAQHDNGWWEWEATPDVSAVDGFPLDLSEVLKDQQAGMNRWRNGLRRFAQSPLPNLIPSANPPSRGLGDDAFELHDVPRQGWSDRVTIRVTPHGNGRLELDPYPFDVDPLPVVLPARVAKLPADKPAHLQSWWNAAEPQSLHFTLCHAKS